MDTFAALAEPTRRRILERLRASETSVGELVSELAVAQTPLRALDDWLEPYRRQWAESLDALERRLDEG